MKFTRVSEEPFIPRTPGTFYSRLVANPDVLEHNDFLYFFFRGQGEDGHDQIGLWKQAQSLADGFNWDKSITEPVVKVSVEPSAYDSDHILDPSAIIFNEAIYLYYTAKGIQDENSYSIGLSVSDDGLNFLKHDSNPILKNAIAPEVIIHDGLIHLFFQRHNIQNDSWELFSRTSIDGIKFDLESERLVFTPSLVHGSIDEKSAATFRIFKADDFYYLSYGACQKFLDYPESFGIAKSKDLLNWERSKSNPIFVRGAAGTWDEAAIWYPTIHKINEKFFMWYEGAGTGNALIDESASEASTLARKVNYGGYLVTSFSQVGLAVLDEKDFLWQ